jgi:16S rRNA (guanine(527)-N(7))-methyltransferase RsmG
VENQKPKIKDQKSPSALLRSGAERMGLALAPEACDRLCRYAAELEKWNRRMNLVGAAPAAEIIEKHFLDSLTLLPLLAEQPADSGVSRGRSVEFPHNSESGHRVPLIRDQRRQQCRQRGLSALHQLCGQTDDKGDAVPCDRFPPDLLDVGTGAGFPGLVLKAVLPELAVTLVEPRRKRVDFLRHIVRTLGLREVNIVEARLDEDGKTVLPQAGYHLVTARALSEIAPFLALVAPYCLPGGRAICMKGSRWEEELNSWRQTEKGEFEMVGNREWHLPFSGDYRCLLTFRKAGPGVVGSDRSV